MSPGFTEPTIEADNWEQSMITSWRHYLGNTLGLNERYISDKLNSIRSGQEYEWVFDMLETDRERLAELKILEIGAGHGMLSIKFAEEGSEVVAVEPSKAWRRLGEARAHQLNMDNLRFVDADAHDLPFEDESFDVVVALQVLEHVRQPGKVIEEISRVLNQKGRAIVSAENYLSFRENHYKIRWFPMLPKSLGSLYLRILGRNPDFFKNHVTYTNYPQLIYFFLKARMWSTRWPDFWKNVPTNLLFLRLLLLHRADLFRSGFLLSFTKF